ncbi:hypothetical protein X975_13351, partial [Stegodyphus mimosarum]
VKTENNTKKKFNVNTKRKFNVNTVYYRELHSRQIKVRKILNEVKMNVNIADIS